MKESFIFRLRQEKGWTQSELARILSVTEKTLSKWERGIGFPNIKTFELLARISGKTLTELLGQEGQDDELLEAIAIYKGEIKTKDRIIVILLGALIFTMVFLLDSMELIGFVSLCLPVLISLIGIIFVFIGQQQRRKKNKSLWLFILGGCFLAYPLVFYVLFFIIVPVVYGGPVPT